MSIISIILVLLFVGLIMWAIQNAPIAIHPWIKNVIMGLIALFVIIWLLNAFGISTGLNVH